MNCNEFQQWLEQAVESRRPTANEVAAFARHLKQCDAPECAARWADHERLAAATVPWQQSIPVVDLVDRVVGELRSSHSSASPQEEGLAVPLRATYAEVRQPAASLQGVPRSTTAQVWRWSTLATLTAALLLMFSLLVVAPPVPTEITTIDTPFTTTTPADPAPVVTAAPQRERSYASMPLSATEFVTDAVVLVVPADLSDPDEEPTRADVWADRLGQRWEPIGRELSDTFETLLHAVPNTSS